MSIGQDLQKYTYAYLMRDALSRIPDTVDTREGSIIYDALAPACYELSIYYSEMRLLVLETYVLTASGEWLDMRTTEYGIDNGFDLVTFDKEKFAELIVRECISAVFDAGPDPEYYQNRIKKHFGVTE